MTSVGYACIIYHDIQGKKRRRDDGRSTETERRDKSLCAHVSHKHKDISREIAIITQGSCGVAE